DQARVVAHLLDALGIDCLHTIVGASYGGMVALQFASAFPDRLVRAQVFCAAHQSSPLATGWRHVQREILALGLRHDDSANAVRIARSLAMCTYRADREFSRRFAPGAGGISSVTDYLDHCGTQFSSRFNAHAYLCLSRSIDAHCVDPANIRVPLDLVGFSSDQIVPPAQLFDLRSKLGGESSLKIVDSQYGHDAFLVETGAVSKLIRRHLEVLS
ncbi:MAG: alpha/beta fold hydrolase, partial [Xanthomonadales bacterium]|nr:alpha/beta fold hydrolase [Xanthomonadales bacterium]